MEVKDKVSIITGASSGLGLAIARLLSNKGAYVALVSRSKEKLEKLSLEIPNSMAVAADMAKAFEVKRMVKNVAEHFDKIDILVNNAGVVTMLLWRKSTPTRSITCSILTSWGQ